MFKKLFGFGKEKLDLEQVFQPDGDNPSVVILSGICCNPLSYGIDDKLKETVKQALARVGKSAEVKTITLTDAREGLDTLSEKNALLIEEIQSIFQSHGLKAFPAVIINSRLAFYGGTPSIDMLVEKLR
jgi:hypothetical protein